VIVFSICLSFDSLVLIANENAIEGRLIVCDVQNLLATCFNADISPHPVVCVLKSKTDRYGDCLWEETKQKKFHKVYKHLPADLPVPITTNGNLRSLDNCLVEDDCTLESIDTKCGAGDAGLCEYCIWVKGSCYGSVDDNGGIACCVQQSWGTISLTNINIKI